MTTGNQEINLPAFSEPVYARRVLCGLSLDGHNVIRPWGVEFADSSAFYSLEDGFGYRYQLLEEKETTGPLTRSLRQILRLREGLVCLELTEGLVSPREFRRDCTLTCLEDTTLMDFVVRFPFWRRTSRTAISLGACCLSSIAMSTTNIRWMRRRFEMTPVRFACTWSGKPSRSEWRVTCISGTAWRLGFSMSACCRRPGARK